MPEFDPRQAPLRAAPLIIGGAVFVAVAAIGVASFVTSGPASKPHAHAKRIDIHALEHQAFAEVQSRIGFSAPQTMPIKVLPGETLEKAIGRTGIAADEARSVVQTLAKAFDTVNIKAGLAFKAAIARPRTRGGPVRLIGLSMQTSPSTAITLSRTFDGALRLRELEEKVTEETAVAQGKMEGSLYEAALDAGADSRIVSEAAKLFSKKLDFARDIHPNDEFRLVFDRKVTENGRTIETGDLLYAEIGAKGQTTRFYRFERDGKANFFDEFGKNIAGFLLRTPVDAVRITSGFGRRFHPVLGYTRMHQGIDFGAPTGTPVYAAGEGVVEEVRRASGYGNWLKIRHAGGWATGYGHLSRYASGLRPGQHVSQGQVVAYVGATGIATGPHLHYEVMQGKVKMDPKGAKVPQGTVLAGHDLDAFKVQKGRIEGLIVKAEARTAGPQMAKLDTPAPKGAPKS
ncbi:MAG: M23 family metallopeptidase [Caulobacteraceae bacterium]